jgi:hypothetical protein
MAQEKVGGYFEVAGGTYDEIELDTEKMTPAEIATALAGQAGGVSLCHQCAHEISDPQVGDLVEFTVGGQTYVRDPLTVGGWKPWSPK